VILEVAVLDIRPGQEAAFEKSFAQAQNLIALMQGYVSHELRQCVEIIRLAFAVPVNIRNGKRCCIIITSRFRRLSIMSRCSNVRGALLLFELIMYVQEARHAKRSD